MDGCWPPLFFSLSKFYSAVEAQTAVVVVASPVALQDSNPEAACPTALDAGVGGESSGSGRSLGSSGSAKRSVGVGGNKGGSGDCVNTLDGFVCFKHDGSIGAMTPP